MAAEPASGRTSSADTTWREGVMLACLIALPAAALRGTKWRNVVQTLPDAVKSIVHSRWGPNAAFAKGPCSESRFEASARASSGLPGARQARPGADQGSAGDAAPKPTRAPRVEACRLVPATTRPVSPPPAGDSDRPTPPATPVPDQLTALLDRLRELGVAYYLLETWGDEYPRFRFHCRMALGASPHYTRHFEATAPDATQAVARVLEEIEAWRAGSLATAEARARD